MSHDDRDARARAFVDRAAEHYGWAVNPDEDFVATIASGLAKNLERFGYYLCPCRDGGESRAADRDIVCPCTYAKADIEEYQQCFCGLFYSRTRPDDDPEPRQIPERRTTR